MRMFGSYTVIGDRNFLLRSLAQILEWDEKSTYFAEETSRGVRVRKCKSVMCLCERESIYCIIYHSTFPFKLSTGIMLVQYIYRLVKFPALNMIYFVDLLDRVVLTWQSLLCEVHDLPCRPSSRSVGQHHHESLLLTEVSCNFGNYDIPEHRFTQWLL